MTSRAAKNNPFRVDQVLKIRYRLPPKAWHTLLTQVTQPHFRGAIVGPEGTGKTTLLEDMLFYIKFNGYDVSLITFNREKKRLARQEVNFKQFTQRHVLGIDGIEQLSFWNRCRLRWLTRRCAGVIVTSHHQTLWPTLHQTHTDYRMFHQILAHLYPAASAMPEPSISAIFQQNHGNIREALRDFYDVWARGGV